MRRFSILLGLVTVTGCGVPMGGQGGRPANPGASPVPEDAAVESPFEPGTYVGEKSVFARVTFGGLAQEESSTGEGSVAIGPSGLPIDEVEGVEVYAGLTTETDLGLLRGTTRYISVIVTQDGISGRAELDMVMTLPGGEDVRMVGVDEATFTSAGTNRIDVYSTRRLVGFTASGVSIVYEAETSGVFER